MNSVRYSCFAAMFLCFISSLAHADIVTGLVGHWKLDGGTSGAIANGQTAGLTDASGQGNHGTAVNTNGTGMAWALGAMHGGAVSFDGVDDYVGTASEVPFNFGTSDFSIACWFKVNALPNAWKALVNKGASGTTGYGVSISSGNRLTGDIQGSVAGVNQHVYCPGSNITAGIWQHGVVVFDREDKVFVYLDGAVRCSEGYSAGNTSSVSRNEALVLGKHYSSEWFLDGLIDDVRIYNRALSPTDVDELYNNGGPSSLRNATIRNAVIR